MVEVRFSKLMIVPSNIAHFNMTVFRITIETANLGDEDSFDNLNFTWNLTEFQ